MPETLLTLTGMGIPPYSARGIKENLAPIDEATHLERDVNGGLLDLSPPQMKKYRLSLDCEDINPPALSGVWPGKVTLTVETISELSFVTAVGFPERTPVIDSTRTEGLFTFYRPVLTMRVVAFSVDWDEWPAKVAWKLELEEE